MTEKDIKRKLEEIDADSIRAMRAKILNDFTPEDEEILKNAEKKAQELREKIK